MSPPTFDRREVLRLGGLSLLAGSLPRERVAAAVATVPRAQACIFMLLQGGPSHHDLWDLKPDAPVEIRGPFSPIATAVPGVQFGPLLPDTARLADRLAVVRSMQHDFNNHIAGTYITLTGSPNQPNIDREAAPDDFPGPAAILNYLQREPSSVPTSVSLPTWLSIPGPSNRMPGQYAGFLGAVHDPFLIAGEPQKSDFKPLCLTLPDDFAPARLQGRKGLLAQLDAAAAQLEATGVVRYDHLSQSAYELLSDARLRGAVDLAQEPDATRDRYGRTKIGQSLLLARRLVEAGVKFVGYNAFNQEWDTHGGLKGRYEDLIPKLDRAYSALIGDLAERGLLDETLVIQAGEFGRTPQINKDAGRDHWPHAYSVVLAGGGIRGGTVYGASDKHGAYVADRPVSPADLLATMWHLMGVDPESELRDRLNRPNQVSRGQIVTELLA
ncbi:MAG: DUF1501 domain-containing protein [Pirellulales bacterium]|nr:DUF1501 domain-containing protein [Pirellulales bacterium]